MKSNFIKRLLVDQILYVTVFLIFTLPVYGLSENQNYAAWFSMFISRIENAGLIMSKDDQEALNQLLAIKPQKDTGSFYQLWFQKAFLPFIVESNNMLDENKALKLRYILGARPEKVGSSAAFKEYFQALIQFIDEIMPSLTPDEETLLASFKDSAPESSPNDYQLWLSSVQKIKDDFGPEYSETEKLILQLLDDLRPTAEIPMERTFKVSAETLLKMKGFILNGRPELAIKEIDKILSQNE